MATKGNITSNGVTDTCYAYGPFVFKSEGTWNSGTFVISYVYQGTTFTFQTTSAITGDSTGEVLVDIPMPPNQKLQVFATLSGATSPDLDWAFIGKVSDNANV